MTHSFKLRQRALARSVFGYNLIVAKWSSRAALVGTSPFALVLGRYINITTNNTWHVLARTRSI